MILATLILTLRTPDEGVDVPIRLFQPEDRGDHWICRYELAWPDRLRDRFVAGLDAMQALHMALRAIGSDIYASEYHKSGALRWTEPDDGYGFPVLRELHAELIGSDRTYEG